MQNAQQQAFRQRSGWTEEENQLLWKSVAQSREMGLPLKNAFDRMAALTGRKANSIRNYYYSQVKENDTIQIGEKTAFTPFTQEEIEGLIQTVLRAQAEGKSVRRITMEMGKGDKKAMLRYQNKYRSIVKNNPELIRRIIMQPGQFVCASETENGAYNPQNIYNMNPQEIHYEIADWAIAGNRLPDVAESLWFYNPFGPQCRSRFPSEVGYWQTRIGDHCFYNPTDAYYRT